MLLQYWVHFPLGTCAASSYQSSRYEQRCWREWCWDTVGTSDNRGIDNSSGANDRSVVLRRVPVQVALRGAGTSGRTPYQQVDPIQRFASCHQDTQRLARALVGSLLTVFRPLAIDPMGLLYRWYP